MKNAVILHGTNGYPLGNWFSWIKKELTKKDYKVWLPQLPDADKPDVDKYNSFLKKGWKYNSETVLIGHSSGAVEILSLLENLDENIIIDKAILVAGFKDNLDWDILDNLFKYSFDWEKIKTRAREFILIHSDNDPYVPIGHGKFLHKKLGGKLIIEKGQKHFSVSSYGKKYKKFPLLLTFLN